MSFIGNTRDRAEMVLLIEIGQVGIVATFDHDHASADGIHRLSDDIAGHADQICARQDVCGDGGISRKLTDQVAREVADRFAMDLGTEAVQILSDTVRCSGRDCQDLECKGKIAVDLQRIGTIGGELILIADEVGPCFGELLEADRLRTQEGLDIRVFRACKAIQDVLKVRGIPDLIDQRFERDKNRLNSDSLLSLSASENGCSESFPLGSSVAMTSISFLTDSGSVSSIFRSNVLVAISFSSFHMIFMLQRYYITEGRICKVRYGTYHP